MNMPHESDRHVLVLGGHDTLWPRITALLSGHRDPAYKVHPASIDEEVAEFIQDALDEGRPYPIMFWAIDDDLGQLAHARELWDVDPRLTIVFCWQAYDVTWRQIADALGDDTGPWHVLQGSLGEAEVLQLMLTTAQQYFQTDDPEVDKLRTELANAIEQTTMLEVSNGVLHNIGNVLNSISVATGLLHDRVHQSKLSSLKRAIQMIQEHADHLPDFISHDERGKHLPRFLIEIGHLLSQEQADVSQELETVARNMEHIKQIISTQQSYACQMGTVEVIKLVDLVEDALNINIAGLERHAVQVRREFDDVPPCLANRHKVLQILVNLISNAKAALNAIHGERCLTLRLIACPADPDYVRVQVIDNGIGIAPEHMQRIFEHGFTTRENGHGFGLHSAIRSAREMDGNLTAASDGPNRGATFTLDLPVAREYVDA